MTTRYTTIIVSICLAICLFALPLVANAAEDGVTVNFANNINLTIDKAVYYPGEEIKIKFFVSRDWASDAWIGIIPANIAHGSEAVNDQHDITYQYINKRNSGEMVFKAPGAGHWDFRMHDTDSNGREMAYVSFTVTNNIPTNTNSQLVLEKTLFSPGEEIRVTFYAPSNWPRDAWIGIIPANIAHGDEAVNDQHDITYQYIDGRTQGTLVFTAPSSGQWDFRMHNTDGGGREFAYVTFTVK